MIIIHILFYGRKNIVKNRKNFLKKAVVLLIAVAMFLSTVAVTANTSTKTISSIKFYNEVQKDSIEGNSESVVLWDNGLHYHNAISSQWDQTHYESIGADDFQFEETTIVTDVHWMSLYGLSTDYDFDWNVSFYMDRGDGNAPGVKIYEEVFLNAMVHETFVEEIEEWNSWMFSYWVDLADAVTFAGGEKYWISIQGIGNPFPRSYWGAHYPVVLHELVWKSPFWDYLEWTTSSEVWDISRDYCFQLTGEGEPVLPDLVCEGNLQWDEVHAGEIVNGSILVFNNGDVGSMLRWEVQSVPSWGTNWTLNWTGEILYSTDFGYIGTTLPEEIIVEVKAPDKKNKKFTGEIVLVNSKNAEDTCIINVVLKTPRDKTINTPLINFLQKHPNLFPLLKILFGF